MAVPEALEPLSINAFINWLDARVRCIPCLPLPATCCVPGLLRVRHRALRWGAPEPYRALAWAVEQLSALGSHVHCAPIPYPPIAHPRPTVSSPSALLALDYPIPNPTHALPCALRPSHRQCHCADAEVGSRLYGAASRIRTQAATATNSESSRSHAVFTVGRRGAVGRAAVKRGVPLRTHAPVLTVRSHAVFTVGRRAGEAAVRGRRSRYESSCTNIS